jgi:hypothetical protein
MLHKARENGNRNYDIIKTAFREGATGSTEVLRGFAALRMGALLQDLTNVLDVLRRAEMMK